MKGCAYRDAPDGLLESVSSALRRQWKHRDRIPAAVYHGWLLAQRAAPESGCSFQDEAGNRISFAVRGAEALPPEMAQEIHSRLSVAFVAALKDIRNPYGEWRKWRKDYPEFAVASRRAGVK